MKYFYLITNYEKDVQLHNTKQIVSYIEEKGGICRYQSVFAESNRVDTEKIPKETQCVLVLGGDGTLIKTARELVFLNLPLIGINFGNLGYLAEIEQDNIRETIDMLFQDKYQVEQRMMLDAEVIRGGKSIYSHMALNDVVVSKGGTGKLFAFKVYVNGQFINKYSADGMIVSTPTGSTAYNLSAGGPIVEPCADIIVLTPVCPHALISRSVVLSADSVVDIEVCEQAGEEKSDTYVNYDGDNRMELEEGDVVHVRKSHMHVQIGKLSKRSFFETLQKKMNHR